MKTKLALSFLLCALVPGVGRTAGPPNHEPTSPAEDLVLKIDVGKTVYSLYEPVVLTYSVTNPTHQTIESGAILDSSNKSLKLTLVSAGGATTPFYAGDTICSMKVGNTIHLAGETVALSVDMLWNEKTHSLAFPKPGHYTIEAGLFVGVNSEPGFIKANPVAIEIDEPSATDRAAIASLGSEEALVQLLHRGAFFYCADRGESTDACYSRLLRFADEYRGSAYAPAAILGLTDAFLIQAKREHTDAHDQVAIDSFHGSLQQVIDLASTFLDRWPDHALAQMIHWRLITALDRIGANARATEALQRFTEKYPERHRQFDPLLRKLGLAPVSDGAGNLESDKGIE